MLGLGIAYFLWYVPYSALAKAMSSGLFPVTHGPIGGVVLLPAAALGMLCAMPVTLTALRWWKYARRRSWRGLSLPWPGRETAMSAFWMALIVGTTTLNFTFPGVSILLMLVLMRIETLVLSPSVDLVRRRKIHRYSLVALGFSALSAVVALSDVDNYLLTLGAVASLSGYLAGYTGRFLIMSRHAKTGDLARDRRYFVEEHMTTPVLLLALLALPALIGQGATMQALRDGFSTFLATPAALPAFAIGVCYEGLFVFTTLIFLDRREYSFCMPVHVCSSLLAGVAASFALTASYGTAPPSAAQFAAAGCVILAAFSLAYPAIRAKLAASTTRERVLLFVCGGNAVRSPMAAAVARAELAGAGVRGWAVRSAGVSVADPGGGVSPRAAEALRELDIPVPAHSARPLTRRMCAESTTVYCMTRAHRAAAVAMAPELSDRIVCLDPGEDVREPTGSRVSYADCARRIRELVRRRVRESLACYPALPVSGG